MFEAATLVKLDNQDYSSNKIYSLNSINLRLALNVKVLIKQLCDEERI